MKRNNEVRLNQIESNYTIRSNVCGTRRKLRRSKMREGENLFLEFGIANERCQSTLTNTIDSVMCIGGVRTTGRTGARGPWHVSFRKITADRSATAKV